MKFTDKAHVGKVKKTADGYLSANAKALRTGIQEYLASELGMVGDHIVKVMRPPESVFSKDSLSSAVHIPVTLGHPEELVTSDNWKDYAIGEVGSDVMRDGEYASFSLMVKDKAGLAAYDAGTREISMGYVADMMPAPDDADYDFIMGPPKYNHLALVDKARAGSEARIGDSAANTWGAAPFNTTEKEIQMTDMKTVVVGDKAVQVAAADADVITKLMKDHEKAISDKDAKIAELKIEVADTAKLVKTDEQIAELINDGVKEIAAVSEKAAKLVDGYAADGKDAMTIRREVIAKVYGDEAVADLKTDAEIKAAFAVARVSEKADPVLDARKNSKAKDMDDPWKKHIKTKGDK